MFHEHSSWPTVSCDLLRNQSVSSMYCAESVQACRALVRWQTLVVFLSLSCDRSQHRHDISCTGQVKKIVRTVSCAFVVHLLNCYEAKRTQNSKHWVVSRQMLKDFNYLDNNAQIMPQHERMSVTTRRVYGGNSISTNQCIRETKNVKIRISNSKEVKIDHFVDRKTAWKM